MQPVPDSCWHTECTELSSGRILQDSFDHWKLNAFPIWSTWQDRGTCILFGDGAGAAVLRAESGNGYLPAAHSDGKKGVALKCKSLFDGDMENQRFRQEEYKMQMDGQEVFKFAVRQVPAVIMEVLEKNTLALDDIDWMILHQANSRIVEAVSRHLKVPLAKFPMNMRNTAILHQPASRYCWMR